MFWFLCGVDVMEVLIFVSLENMVADQVAKAREYPVTVRIIYVEPCEC